MSEQEENVESEKLAEDIRQIKEMGSVTLPDAKHVIHCLKQRPSLFQKLRQLPRNVRAFQTSCA